MQLDLYPLAEVIPYQLIGHQGGTRRKTALWLRRQDLWVVLDLSAKEGGRYWNCFGFGEPVAGKSLPITVEINPPHAGTNPQVAGMFVRDDQGRQYIGHTGRMGGSHARRKGTTFRDFARNLDWQEVNTPRGPVELHVLGPLGSGEFLRKLVKFVRKVHEFKAPMEG